ncbi:hypothetical protein ACLKA6_002112 [Drosophila palustris]
MLPLPVATATLHHDTTAPLHMPLYTQRKHDFHLYRIAERWGFAFDETASYHPGAQWSGFNVRQQLIDAEMKRTQVRHSLTLTLAKGKAIQMKQMNLEQQKDEEKEE